MPKAATSEYRARRPVTRVQMKSTARPSQEESESGAEESVLSTVSMSQLVTYKPSLRARRFVAHARRWNAGFESDDEAAIDVREHVRLLHLAADMIEEQLDVADPQFIENAMRATRSAARWARDIEEHEKRLAMPTNAHERGQALSPNIIGYKYNAGR
ncbi:uncharacterized protein B0H18DRAFT_1117392 [Fomitopsis serialis]|uniref:uncharacterized protein n=1 Tax=Fomitopsis serialis TaxID=139415 RepID=UPI0020085A3C|nr:uncharacterized protein B0H18DRAFT_1117392 [Neoantrodia serialis]KAH9929343.1 hypothetical protein B0H18DRAFT_1117392 [Neoantrodia serialis]